MAFFSDLKKISASALNAASEGAKFLNEAGSALERGSHILLLETRAKRIDYELTKAGLLDLSVEEQEQKENELLSIYRELISLLDEREKKEWENKKSELIYKQKKREITKRVEKIADLQQRIELSNASLPIEKISKLKSLLSLIDNLIAYLGNSSENNLISELKTIKSESLGEIKLLESKRASEHLVHYPSGALKSKVCKHDGVLHGTSEFWHENGKKRLCVSFNEGQLTSQAKKWREDGSLLLKAHYGQSYSAIKLELFTKEGVRIICLDLDKYKNGWAQYYLANGIYLGRVYLHEGKLTSIKKFLFFFRLSLNFPFWIRMLRIKKINQSAGLRISYLFDETANYMAELNEYSAEIKSFETI